MRIIVDLKAIEGRILPYNFNYPFSAAIYKLLRLGSEEYAQFLHNHGYTIDNRGFKLFSFGLKMQAKPYENKGHHLKNPNVQLIVSSPKIDEFMQHFTAGTFYSETIEISQMGTKIVFAVLGFKLLPKPGFTNSEKFKLISPMLLTKPRNDPGKPPKYLLPEDEDDASIALSRNLLRKYRLLYNPGYESAGVKIEFDKSYLQKTKRPTMLIKVKEGSEDETALRAIMCPFTLTGDPLLIKTGYECGYGSNNSMGLGLAELISPKPEENNHD